MQNAKCKMKESSLIPEPETRNLRPYFYMKSPQFRIWFDEVCQLLVISFPVNAEWLILVRRLIEKRSSEKMDRKKLKEKNY
jgi:hypothetical protein